MEVAAIHLRRTFRKCSILTLSPSLLFASLLPALCFQVVFLQFSLHIPIVFGVRSEFCNAEKMWESCHTPFLNFQDWMVSDVSLKLCAHNLLSLWAGDLGKWSVETFKFLTESLLRNSAGLSYRPFYMLYRVLWPFLVVWVKWKRSVETV